MQLAQIRMESTTAKLAMRTNHASVSIEQSKAGLTIEQPPAEMKITTTPGQLTIDQSKAREDMDLKSVFKRTEEFAQLGYEGFLEGVARRSAEGDQLMRIEDGGNPIAAHAEENSKSREYEFNVGWIPSHFSVKTNFVPAKLDIEVEPRKPIITVQPNKPILTYSPGKVEYMMENDPSLKIDFVNLP
jgi:hypothetical protein